MADNFTHAEFDLLRAYKEAGNREAYYSLLAEKGDLYGNMALGVVRDDGMAGSIARDYAEAVAEESGGSVDWENLLNDLMNADFALREELFEQGTVNIELENEAIQAYHNSVFIAHDLPKEAWIAEIPLGLAENRAALWDSMLNSNGGSYLDGFFEVDNLVQKHARQERDLRREAGEDMVTLGDNPDTEPASFLIQHLHSPSVILPGLIEGGEGTIDGESDLIFGDSSFDSSSYGFDIGTSFSHGNLQNQTDTFGSDLSSIRDDGLVISGGNWHVTSKTLNYDGHWANMNAAISDWFIPAQAKTVEMRVDQQVAELWNVSDAEASDPSRLNDLSISTSYVSGGSSDRAEIDLLVLDLDGDGVELTPFGDNYLFFDMDNDGHDERTGWVGPDDGILVHDLDGDGKINDITETLSEYYGAEKGTGAIYGSSFEALATLDSHYDGKIDSNDSAFSELRIWRDANQNGETDEGELKSLAEAGVTEFSLNGTADGSFIGGNEVKSNATYRKDDGSSHVMAAVNFIADPRGLTQEADGAATRIELEDGAATYSVGDANGETVDATTKNVANIIGGTGDDILIGDDGNNWLVGSLGEDQLHGGAGHDYLVADAADIANTQDNIQGGAGFDIVQFVGDQGVAFNLQQSQVEMAIGTDEADILASGSSDQSIINGGGGHDVILGGSAGDVLNGEEGNDAVYGYQGNDLIRGHRGADNLIGGDGDDILQGGLDSDVLSGDAGEDLLDGGAGDDRLDGGDGYDVAQYSGSYGDYTVTANENGTYTVTDRRDGSPDGTDTLKNVEALNFSDINEVQIDGDNPLPAKDVVRVSAEQDGKTYRVAIPDLLANDLDYQGDSLSLREVFDAIGGSVSIDGDEVVFVVEDGFNGIPSFSYHIVDEHGNKGLQVGAPGTDVTAEMSAKVTLVLDHHPEDPQFLNQWYLPAINVLPVWEDYTGKGVKVAITEPGPWDGEDYGHIDYHHTDLINNIDTEALRTYNPNIMPTQHATLVAGVIGASRNGEGGIGVAYDVTLSSEGIKNNDDEGNGKDHSAVLNWYNYDVVNASFGSSVENSFLGGDDYFDVTLSNGSVQSINVVGLAALWGRDGLGTNIVFDGGDDRQEGGDVNTTDWNNSRHAISVGAEHLRKLACFEIL